MKVKIDAKLMDADGKKPIVVDQSGTNLTLREVCIKSLLTPIKDEDERKKWKRYEIFKKVRDGADTIELKAEEIVLVKEYVGKTQPVLVMGQCWELLEGK
jgi:hypothetical protein